MIRSQFQFLQLIFMQVQNSHYTVIIFILVAVQLYLAGVWFALEKVDNNNGPHNSAQQSQIKIINFSILI